MLLLGHAMQQRLKVFYNIYYKKLVMFVMPLHDPNANT